MLHLVTPDLLQTFLVSTRNKDGPKLSYGIITKYQSFVGGQKLLFCLVFLRSRKLAEGSLEWVACLRVT